MQRTYLRVRRAAVMLRACCKHAASALTKHHAGADVAVVEDALGLTFEEWDPTKDADDSQPLVPMIINASELRGAGFNLQEVIPPALEAAARSGRRTRGAGLRQLEGMGRKRFVFERTYTLVQFG